MGKFAFVPSCVMADEEGYILGKYVDIGTELNILYSLHPQNRNQNFSDEIKCLNNIISTSK